MNYLALDIGGSKLVTGIVSDKGDILYSVTERLGRNYKMEDMLGAIDRTIPNLTDYGVAACGVAIPGLADRSNGDWLYAPFSGEDFPLRDVLTERVSGLPIFVDNDVSCCAIGELTFGKCVEERDFLWLDICNGIGGALVFDGKLYRGKHNCAGEIGHFRVEEHDAELCGCGNLGCLEAMASGNAITKRYYLRCGEKLTAREVADKAKNGDAVAVEIFNKAGYYLGKAVSYVVNLLNIDKIVIGGGVSQSAELFLPQMRTTMQSAVLASANPMIKIQKTGLGQNAGLLGAAAVAKNG